MKVSVVIPAYNEEGYLGACLNSLMKQRIKPDEIIVVNNNSTDRTVEIASKYPVRIVNEEVQGMIAARNRGFTEAKYDVIARTDADSIVPSDWIKKIHKHFEDPHLAGLSGPPSYYELPEVITETYRVSADAIFKSYIKILTQVLRHPCLFGPNMALRKDSWDKIKDDVCTDDKKVHEDIDLAIHLATVGKIVYDPKLTVKTSFRRWKKIDSLPEYLYRALTSVRNKNHQEVKVGRTGIRAIKNFLAKTLDPEMQKK
jgi:glycosyltransferase involved in cell wall biosynthesis